MRPVKPIIKRQPDGSGLGQLSRTPALSLFQIDAEMTMFLARLADGGEMTPEEDAYYASLLEQAKTKCDGYVSMIVHMSAQLDAGKALLQEASQRVRRWEAARDGLRNRLATFMANHGIKELRPESPLLPKAFLQKGRQKLNFEPDRLPEGLYDIKTEKVPDRDKIEEALKGGDVPGVTVTTGEPFITLR